MSAAAKSSLSAEQKSSIAADSPLSSITCRSHPIAATVVPYQTGETGYRPLISLFPV
jgi:hypothetical protein